MTIEWALWAPVLLAGVVAGGSTGALGTYVVGMRVPFLGICVSHAALAGGVFGALAGLTGPALLGPALLGAVAAAMLLGTLDPDRLSTDANVLMGVLFSFTMGLAFLGIGLAGRFGVSDANALGLLWGSLTLCSWADLALMLPVAAAQILFTVLLFKEMRAILFSRHHAAAAGVHVSAVWTAFLLLAAAVLTVNFQIVGGLMIYALMVNPAAAAFQLVRGCGKALALSALLGALSGLGGFLASLLLGIPTGAAIVILSSLLVAAAWALGRLLRR